MLNGEILDDDYLNKVVNAFHGLESGDPFASDEEEEEGQRGQAATDTLETMADTSSYYQNVIKPEKDSKKAALVNSQVQKAQTTATQKAEELGAGGVLGAQLANEAKQEVERWFKKYDNGLIPTDALDEVKGFGLVRPDAADSLRALQRAARKAGYDLTGGGYRSYDEQAALYDEKPGLAAPAGKSNHGWGVAIDVSGLTFDSELYGWLRKNGLKYGWNHPSWARATGSKPEPWHWEYTGGGDFTPKVNAQKKPRQKSGKVKAPPGRDRVLTAMEFEDASLPLSSGSSFELAVLAMATEPDERTVEVAQRETNQAAARYAANLKDVPKPLRKVFQRVSQRTDVPIALLIEVARQESQFTQHENPNYAGAIGMMQVIPKWHPQFDAQKLATNATYNLMAGAIILRNYIEMKGGVAAGLAAYNAGPNATGTALAQGQQYAKEILARVRALGRGR